MIRLNSGKLIKFLSLIFFPFLIFKLNFLRGKWFSHFLLRQSRNLQSSLNDKIDLVEDLIWNFWLDFFQYFYSFYFLKFENLKKIQNLDNILCKIIQRCYLIMIIILKKKEKKLIDLLEKNCCSRESIISPHAKILNTFKFNSFANKFFF